MSYRAGCRRVSGLSSLGNTNEDPSFLAQRLNQSMFIYQATAKGIPSGHATLAERAARIQQWLYQVGQDMASGRYRDARIKLNTIDRLITELSMAVGLAKSGLYPEEGSRSSSGFLSTAGNLFSFLGGGGAADTVAAWLLPAIAGLGVVLLLRR